MRLFGRQFPIWLFVAYILALSAIVLWPCVAFGSMFAFDDPATANLPNTYQLVGLVMAYPIIPIVGVIGSVLFFRGDHRRLAYGLAALALVPFAFFVAAIVWSNVTTLLYALNPRL